MDTIHNQAFKLQVLRIEAELQCKHNADPDLFPLFEPNEVDSYVSNYKINRIAHLHRTSPALTQPDMIYGACYEVLCLRKAAKRAMEEELARKRSVSHRSTITNLASLTSMVAAVGSLVLFMMGDNNGKAKPSK